MADEQKSQEYEEALKKFLAEEDARRTKFDAQLEEKSRQRGSTHTNDLKMTKIRLEAEIARKKLAIDDELRVRVAQLWKECDAKVNELKEKIEADIQQMIKEKMEELQQKIEALRASYQQMGELRKQTLDDEVKQLEQVFAGMNLDDDEADRRQFLKKELVEFKAFSKTPMIADEDALRRLGIAINKQAICMSDEYIMYRATCPQGECVVKIVVLQDRHSSYRNKIAACSKIARNLMSGDIGKPRHPAFVVLYNFFLSCQKTYCFMEECTTANLEILTKTFQIDERQLQIALKEVLAGLEFMHIRAIAHLNLHSESVIFTKDGAAKIVGLCYAEHYFNADTETFFKLPKVDRRREFLPAECYLDDRYEPVFVDVYSFGYLLYTSATNLQKKKRMRKIGHIELSILPDGPMRSFVEETCAREPTQRPKIGELKGKPYFAS